jgi:hypothetical protein
LVLIVVQEFHRSNASTHKNHHSDRSIPKVRDPKFPSTSLIRRYGYARKCGAFSDFSRGHDSQRRRDAWCSARTETVNKYPPFGVAKTVRSAEQAFANLCRSIGVVKSRPGIKVHPADPLVNNSPALFLLLISCLFSVCGDLSNESPPVNQPCSQKSSSRSTLPFRSL